MGIRKSSGITTTTNCYLLLGIGLATDRVLQFQWQHLLEGHHSLVLWSPANASEQGREYPHFKNSLYYPFVFEFRDRFLGYPEGLLWTMDQQLKDMNHE